MRPWAWNRWARLLFDASRRKLVAGAELCWSDSNDHVNHSRGGGDSPTPHAQRLPGSEARGARTLCSGIVSAKRCAHLSGRALDPVWWETQEKRPEEGRGRRAAPREHLRSPVWRAPRSGDTHTRTPPSGGSSCSARVYSKPLLHALPLAALSLR